MIVIEAILAFNDSNFLFLKKLKRGHQLHENHSKLKKTPSFSSRNFEIKSLFVLFNTFQSISYLIFIIPLGRISNHSQWDMGEIGMRIKLCTLLRCNFYIVNEWPVCAATQSKSNILFKTCFFCMCTINK